MASASVSRPLARAYWLRAFFKMREIDTYPHNQIPSLDALFTAEMFRRGKAFGAIGAEASWILEDNDKLIRPLESMGLKEYRRWRIYDRTIAPSR